jgi:hypothetical protein
MQETKFMNLGSTAEIPATQGTRVTLNEGF